MPSKRPSERFALGARRIGREVAGVPLIAQAVEHALDRAVDHGIGLKRLGVHKIAC